MLLAKPASSPATFANLSTIQEIPFACCSNSSRPRRRHISLRLVSDVKRSCSLSLSLGNRRVTQRRRARNVVRVLTMKLWFAKRMKECPQCQSSIVRRAPRRGFHEQVVHRLAFVWPYECLRCKLRFLGFHRSYSRRYVKPYFHLGRAAASSK